MSVKIIKYGDPKKGAQKSIEAGNAALLARVATQAKLLAPVDKGALRNSIHWKTPENEGGFNDSSGEKATRKVSLEPKKNGGFVGSGLFYAPYIEFGTRRMKAQPYLIPAVIIEVFGPNGQNILKDEAIEQMAKSLMKGRKQKNV